jgi:hypothetical protein
VELAESSVVPVERAARSQRMLCSAGLVEAEGVATAFSMLMVVRGALGEATGVVAAAAAVQRAVEWDSRALAAQAQMESL